MNNNMERLQKEKYDMILRHQREREAIDKKIVKEKEHIKIQKESDKRKKEQQLKQNNSNRADDSYQNFVKDSMSIAKLNEALKELLK